MDFTNCAVVGRMSGEFGVPPTAPIGRMVIPYVDEGYHGGLYWAVLPKGISAATAAEIFEDEGHMTSLVAVGWDECMQFIQTSLQDEFRALMLRVWNGDVRR